MQEDLLSYRLLDRRKYTNRLYIFGRKIDEKNENLIFEKTNLEWFQNVAKWFLLIFIYKKKQNKLENAKEVAYTKMCKSDVSGIYVRGCLYRLYNKQENRSNRRQEEGRIEEQQHYNSNNHDDDANHLFRSHFGLSGHTLQHQKRT